jgi:Xaa-Pro dipeptidase
MKMQSKAPNDGLDALRGSEASFSRDEFARRQARAVSALVASGHEALVVTGPETIYWLTGRQTAGYFAFQALILTASGELTLLVRQLELYGTVANTWLSDIVVYQDGESPVSALVALLRDREITRPAIELGGWFLPPRLADEIARELGQQRLADGSDILPPLRMVKSADELAAIRAAARYAEAGMIAAIDACRGGANENDIAAAMLRAAAHDLAPAPVGSGRSRFPRTRGQPCPLSFRAHAQRLDRRPAG